MGRNRRQKGYKKQRRHPQALKRQNILNDLAARVELVPFPNRQSSSATRKSRASLVSPLGKGTSLLVPFRRRYWLTHPWGATATRLAAKNRDAPSGAKALNHSERLGGTSGTRALPNRTPEFFGSQGPRPCSIRADFADLNKKTPLTFR